MADLVAVVDRGPLNPLRAVDYFSHFFEKPWNELFGGQLVLVTEMPRSYVPTLLALKLPEIFSALAIAGIVGALVAAADRSLTAIAARCSCWSHSARCCRS